jgi:hypothetical protein
MNISIENLFKLYVCLNQHIIAWNSFKAHIVKVI